ncbi:MAG: hypothetical protein K2X25_08285 [Caulobacteraceae bacterium]|nr:hypothetical protein [Caulobacteraceae bacterium]
MRVFDTQRLATGLLMLVILASCSDAPQSDNGAQGQTLAASREASDGAQTNAAPDAFSDEIDPSDQRLNSPGAGRDLTLAVKDDPAAMDALVGSWAGSTESCNSGEAIGFFPDGTYGLEGEGGRWVLAGDVLRFESVKIFEMGVEGEVPAKKSPVRLTAIDATRMRWQLADGSQTDFVRCPPNP